MVICTVTLRLLCDLAHEIDGQNAQIFQKSSEIEEVCAL